MTRHNFALYRREDNGDHLEVCSDCGAERPHTEHRYDDQPGMTVCDSVLRCVVCGEEWGPLGHSWGEIQGSTWHGHNEAKCTRCGTWEMIE